jgi:TusA-related sulfurtransferase
MIHRLNAQRLLFPLLVIKVQGCVKQLKSNDILEIMFTDKGGLSDILAWYRLHGHYLEIFMVIRIGN